MKKALSNATFGLLNLLECSGERKGSLQCSEFWKNCSVVKLKKKPLYKLRF